LVFTVTEGLSGRGSMNAPREDRSVPFFPIAEWNAPARMIDQSRRCQPADVQQSRPARSSDSSAVPKRSF
jgi:hypothetical protein